MNDSSQKVGFGKRMHKIEGNATMEAFSSTHTSDEHLPTERHPDKDALKLCELCKGVGGPPKPGSSANMSSDIPATSIDMISSVLV